MDTNSGTDATSSNQTGFFNIHEDTSKYKIFYTISQRFREELNVVNSGQHSGPLHFSGSFGSGSSIGLFSSVAVIIPCLPPGKSYFSKSRLLRMDKS